MRDDPRVVELRELGATIGSDVYFGPEVYVEKDFAPLLVIEDGVVVSHGTIVLLHDSSLNNVAGEPLKFGSVVLRRNCYIGARSTLLCGVEVGAGALVGACALVADDVPAASVAVGQPARVIGTVEESVRRSRERGDGGRFFHVPVSPWRDRTEEEYPAFDRALLDEIDRHVAQRERR